MFVFKKIFALLMSIVLLSSLLAACSQKDYLYRNINLGMSIDEVKENETADLHGTYDIGGTYAKKLYF